MEFWQRYVLKNMKLKVFAIGIAALLWLSVSYIGESKMGISVRVSQSNLARGLMIVKLEPDYVLVTLSGPVSVLKNISARDVSVSIDLAGVPKGTHVLPLPKENVKVNKGVKVEEVKPDNIVVDVDAVVEKRLRVGVKLDRKWVDAYRVRSVVPSTVVVEGPSKSLRDRTVVMTLTVEGPFTRDEEAADVAIDTKDLAARSIRPDTVRVMLKKN
jgi:YbbR domain-containing protein